MPVDPNPLVGTWRLRSFEMRASDGSVIYPLGREAVGYAIFSLEGYVFSAMMDANRKRFQTEDMRGGSLEEKAGAADSFVSYGGPCEIEKDKLRVKVEVSLFPNWVGGYQERYFKIDGRTLSISSTPLLVGGREVIGHLTFERV